MNILILGGTRFLGKALVEEGLKRGHEITLFNRGNNKEAFSEVEQLIGPFDYTERLPYWVQRVAEGGSMLVPGRPDRPIQLIDVKDIATRVFNMAERGKADMFNVTGSEYELTMEELLNTCKAVTHSNAEFVWADEQFVLNSVEYRNQLLAA